VHIVWVNVQHYSYSAQKAAQSCGYTEVQNS